MLAVKREQCMCDYFFLVDKDSVWTDCSPVPLCPLFKCSLLQCSLVGLHRPVQQESCQFRETLPPSISDHFDVWLNSSSLTICRWYLMTLACLQQESHQVSLARASSMPDISSVIFLTDPPSCSLRLNPSFHCHTQNWAQCYTNVFFSCCNGAWINLFCQLNKTCFYYEALVFF